MKKLLLFLLTIAISACVLVKQEEINLAAKLEAAKDPLLAIQTFIDVYHRCKTNFGGYRYFEDSYENNSYKYYKSYMSAYTNTELTSINQLSIEDINIDCFIGRGVGGWEVLYKDKSDACIAQRRKYKSKLCNFDYKRFLPKSSKIKTEDDFIKVMNHYEARMADCDSLEEATTNEKEQCREKIKENILRFSDGKKTKDCKVALTERIYFEAMRETLNIAFTDNPQGEKELARARILFDELIKDYGRKNLCSIAGYINDIRTLRKKMP